MTNKPILAFISIVFGVLLLFDANLWAQVDYSKGFYFHHQASQGNALNLTNVKDLKLGFGISRMGFGGSSNYFHHNLQVAYSPVKNIGIIGNYLQLYPNKNHPKNRAFNLDLGVGTYWVLWQSKEIPTSKNKMRRQISADLYVVGSLSRQNNTYTKYNFFSPVNPEGYSTTAFARSTFTQFFVQGGFHFQFEKIKLSYLIKLGQLDYRKVNFKGLPEILTYEHSNLGILDPFTSIQQDFRLEVGANNVKFFVGLTNLHIPINWDKMENIDPFTLDGYYPYQGTHDLEIIAEFAHIKYIHNYATIGLVWNIEHLISTRKANKLENEL